MALLENIHHTAFLGAEFLTWLWYRSEQDPEMHLGNEIEPFEVYFDDRLLVGSPMINAQENLFKGGHPTSSLEAKTALRLGKFAHEAKVRITRQSQEWSFTLRAAQLMPSGIKLPAVLAREDEDRFYERMFLLESLDAMLKALFSCFLQRRLAPTWTTIDLPALQAWVRGEAVETPPMPEARTHVRHVELEAATGEEL